MAERDVRTPVAEAVTEDFRARYPDMPVHLARGLGATYAAVVEARDTAVLNQVRREIEMRERLGDGVVDAAQDATQPVSDAELRRVIAHERSGDLSEPFEVEAQRLAYRDAIERDLDADQIDRLRVGDVDILKPRIEDRLDRLYAAKVYLQSDEATANSEATRAVVEEIADPGVRAPPRRSPRWRERARGDPLMTGQNQNQATGRLAVGVVLVTLVAALIGYVIASRCPDLPRSRDPGRDRLLLHRRELSCDPRRAAGGLPARQPDHGRGRGGGPPDEPRHVRFGAHPLRLHPLADPAGDETERVLRETRHGLRDRQAREAPRRGRHSSARRPSPTR